MMRSRFIAVRLRTVPHDERWLLIEWPKGSAEPAKNWLANLAAATPLKELVRTATLRCHIEWNFQGLKQELGVGYFEGRSWRGSHGHANATLCIAVYGFLVTERCAFAPLTSPTADAYYYFVSSTLSIGEDFKSRATGL